MSAHRTSAAPSGLPVRTQIRAGFRILNHNEVVVKGLPVRTQIRAGGQDWGHNHNEVVVAR